MENKSSQPEQPTSKAIHKATRAYLQLPTHKKLEIWRFVGYTENFNNWLSLQENDEPFFKWIRDNSKQADFVKKLIPQSPEQLQSSQPEQQEDNINDTVHCGNCGYDFNNCECGNRFPVYGQEIAQPQPPEQQREESMDMIIDDRDIKNELSGTDNLKDCPFCGKSPVIYGQKNKKTGNIVYYINCPGLECSASVFCCASELDAARNLVIKKWNNRPSSPTPKEQENEKGELLGYIVDDFENRKESFIPASQKQEPVVSGGVWMRASGRLPKVNGDIIWRFIGRTNSVGCCYKEYFGFIDHNNLPSKDYENIEWLDETPSPSSSQLDKQLQESLLLYNNQTATIMKWGQEIERLKGLIEKMWNRDIHTGYDQLFDTETKDHYWGKFKAENNI